MREGICEKVTLILSRTHDGNDLSPLDLKLTEMACNDRLTEYGRARLDALARYVEKNEYNKTWDKP